VGNRAASQVAVRTCELRCTAFMAGIRSWAPRGLQTRWALLWSAARFDSETGLVKCSTVAARGPRTPMAPLSETERRDFWEICEDRYQTRSMILTSRLPVARWHEQDCSVANRPRSCCLFLKWALRLSALGTS